MTYDEILSFWTNENIVRWETTDVAGLAIPDEAKMFLCKVGLPINVDWTWGFGPTYTRLHRYQSMVQIGSDDDLVPICLAEDRMGCVTALEDVDLGLERFINTSVSRFGCSLVIYQKLRLGAKGLPKPQILTLLEQTEADLRREDPLGFAHVENWWPVVLEHARYDLG